MNSMASNDEIKCYLFGLVVVLPVAQLRPRKPPNEAAHREASYSYRVKYMRCEVGKNKYLLLLILTYSAKTDANFMCNSLTLSLYVRKKIDNYQSEAEDRRWWIRGANISVKS